MCVGEPGDMGVTYMIRWPGSRNGMYLMHVSRLNWDSKGGTYRMTRGSPWIMRGTIAARRASKGMILGNCVSTNQQRGGYLQFKVGKCIATK